MSWSSDCDLINPCKPPKDGRCLMDLLDVCHLKHLVTQPTRMKNATKTLIDLILTNNTRRVLRTGVVDTHICDHSLVYTILWITLPRLRSRKMNFSSFKNFDRDKFLEDLGAVPFHIMEVFYDPDDMYVFESLYNDTINTRLWSMLMYTVIKFPTWTIIIT